MKLCQRLDHSRWDSGLWNHLLGGCNGSNLTGLKQLLRHERLLGRECLLWGERGETRPNSSWNLGNDMLDGSGHLVVGHSYGIDGGVPCFVLDFKRQFLAA